MSRSLRRGSAALLLLALAGCAGSTATHTYVFNRDVRSHIQYAAYTGPAQAVILNSPFDNAVVIEAMQRRNPGPPIGFTAGAGGANYRVVVAFGEPPVGQNNYCQASSLAVSPAPASRTDVSAAFCIGDILLTQATASTSHIDTAQDPRLARLMQDLLSALMPYNDPTYINDQSGTSVS